MTTNSLEYATLQMAMRPPRVAIIFNGEGNWQYWARLALYASTRLWGGRGFVLVPHKAGEVSPELLRAVRAYDPDYVVSLEETVGAWEEAQPGVLSIPDPEGGETDQLGGTHRSEFIAANSAVVVDSPQSERARRRVAESCTPHRRRMSVVDADGEPQWDEITECSIEGDIGNLTKAADTEDPAEDAFPDGLRFPGAPCVSAPADWGGVLGVAVAATCGAVDLPHAGSDPDLSKEDFRSLAWWLIECGLPPRPRPIGKPISQIIWHPGAVLAHDPTTLDPAFQRTMRGLSMVSRGIDHPERALVSIGDTAEDFALAYAHQRLYGRGVWLPSSWVVTTEAVTTFMVRSALETLARKGVETTVTSSLAEPEVDAIVARISDPVTHGGFGDRQERHVRPGERIKHGSPNWSIKHVQYLAITEDLYRDVTVPIRRSDTDNVEMVVPCPAPVVTDASLVNAASRFPNPDKSGPDALHWQVDVQILGTETPTGRGLEGQELLAEDREFVRTTVRSGRDGVTYASAPLGLLSSGMPLTTRLARPRLRAPSVGTWANLMASRQNHTMILSPAGRRVEIVRRMWGNRVALTEDFSGPMAPVLHRFEPKRKAEDLHLSEEEGVPLATGAGDIRFEPYLTLAGIRRAAGVGLQPDEVRRETDRLLQLGVLRRGLLLLCEQCNRPGFVPIDDIRQVNECPRCQARNDLTQPRWKKPADEPTWFYDLHAVVRDLIAQNGHVPLLLSHYLRTNSRSYADAAELELYKANKRLAEVDLLALADGQLITAEAKRPADMGSGAELKRAASKRALLAEQVQADQVVLATAAPQWPETAVKAMCHAVSTHHWSRVVPRVRLISGLGTGTIVDLAADTRTAVTSPWGSR